jgi:hypothetical protein
MEAADPIGALDGAVAASGRPGATGAPEMEDLARSLHERMETLDPTLDSDLDKLTDARKGFYRCCVEWVIACYKALPTTTK